MADDGQGGAPGDEGPRRITQRLPVPPPHRPPAPPPYAPQYGAPPQYGPPGYQGPPQQYGWYGPPPQYGAPGRYGPPPQYGPPGYHGPPPQYGGWGPPAGPPPGTDQDAEAAPARGNRRRLVVLLAVALVVVVAGVAAVLVLIQRGGNRVLSTSAVERDVASQFEAAQGVSVRLSCDRSMPLVTAATYHCRGVTGEGESVTITIKVTDGKAATYTWTDR